MSWSKEIEWSSFTKHNSQRITPWVLVMVFLLYQFPVFMTWKQITIWVLEQKIYMLLRQSIILWKLSCEWSPGSTQFWSVFSSLFFTKFTAILFWSPSSFFNQSSIFSFVFHSFSNYQYIHFRSLKFRTTQNFLKKIIRVMRSNQKKLNFHLKDVKKACKKKRRECRMKRKNCHLH